MQRWPTRHLPANLTPVGTRCIQITIPDDDDWERAMYAEVSTLAQWMRWQRDLGHNGKPVADLWLAALKTWSHCDGTPSPVHGIEQEDFMPLRVDCDCNVFVTCCDGTEKQLLTADQVLNLLAGQPGAGAPQPPAGGGCQQYPAQLLANGRWLVPTIVSTGDTVELGSAVGATNDGSELIWHCPDGSQFFAGTCVASGGLDGSDPLPTVQHMRLIVNIDGSYYDAMAGPITVPGGVSNAQVYVQVNDDDLTDNTGQIQFVVTVCNNQLGTFSHTFNFALRDEGFVPQPDGSGGQLAGQWTSGVGWVTTDFPRAGVNWRAIDLLRTFPARDITGEGITYNLAIGTIDSPGGFTVYEFDVAGTAVVSQDSSAVDQGTGVVKVYVDPVTGATTVELTLISDRTAGAASGSAAIRSVTISGKGSDPF